MRTRRAFGGIATTVATVVAFTFAAQFRHGLHEVSPLAPLPRVLVPRGPASQLFLAHNSAVMDYSLIMEHGHVSREVSGRIGDLVRWSSYIQDYRAAWRERVHGFRRHLKDNVPRSLLSRLQRSAIRDLGGDCECDCDPPQIVDAAVVIPMPVERFNESWPTMESLLGQHVLPRETILVLTEATTKTAKQVLAFLTVLSEEYVSRLPEDVFVKVYSSPSKHFPNDNRWFGFNQTTARFVTFFDGDDYMHPRLFEFVQKSFASRPELDFMLIQYASGTIEGSYDVGHYDKAISDFLKEFDHDNDRMETTIDFPNKLYQELRDGLPTWNKTWYLGNTDAEPNWTETQRWWDYGCHNGWVSMKRRVL
eukprot:Polyplicarium_translucidae@DN1911_c0_g1_i1.p1